jgi:hypothetical protein
MAKARTATIEDGDDEAMAGRIACTIGLLTRCGLDPRHKAEDDS